MSGPTSNGGARRPRVARVGEVVRTSRVTPHMIRVVLGGEGLAGFPAGAFTDHYVDQLELWRTGRTLPMRWNRGPIDREAATRQTLTPR